LLRRPPCGADRRKNSGERLLLDAGRSDSQCPCGADLEERGIRKTENIQSLSAGDTVIIRSHGERKDILDALEAEGVRCVNATCPNVMRIQKIVAEAEKDGRQSIIVGEPNHPEVLGVASWCRNPVILDGPEKVRAWLEEDPARKDLSVTVVAQTTCIREFFETSAENHKKRVYKRRNI
jgi:4-hydroxy-3-methylbut-2-enyl diphosphate reductase IspH